jgi:hypothetical protein
MLDLVFNAFGITLTAAAIYGALDGEIGSPIGFAISAVAVLYLPTSLKRENKAATPEGNAYADGRIEAAAGLASQPSGQPALLAAAARRQDGGYALSVLLERR